MKRYHQCRLCIVLLLYRNSKYEGVLETCFGTFVLILFDAVSANIYRILTCIADGMTCPYLYNIDIKVNFVRRQFDLSTSDGVLST